MLYTYLVHRVTISIKLRPVKLEQAVSESLPHKGLYTELLGVQLTCLDPVPASIRARNAQEINITNCDVTTWSWVPRIFIRRTLFGLSLRTQINDP